MAYTERKYDSGKMRRKYERGKGSGGTYGTYEKGTSPSGSDVALLWKTDTAGYEQLCQMDPAGTFDRRSGWRCQQFICRVSRLGDTVSDGSAGGRFIITFWRSADCILISEDWKRGQRNKPGTLYDPVAG